jgi:AhpD family alkylhydroperoxidase
MLPYRYKIATVGRYGPRMARAAVEREMEEMLGTALSVLDRVPDELVEAEWDLIKRAQFGETLIPTRYKELIGVAVAAVMRCPYGARLHTELARLQGATDAEVAEAVRYAGLVSGWSMQMAGLQLDPADFAVEVDRTVAHLARRMGLDPDRGGSS